MSRFRSKSRLPVLASECPGWICYAEKKAERSLPYIRSGAGVRWPSGPPCHSACFVFLQHDQVSAADHGHHCETLPRQEVGSQVKHSHAPLLPRLALVPEVLCTAALRRSSTLRSCRATTRSSRRRAMSSSARNTRRETCVLPECRSPCLDCGLSFASRLTACCRRPRCKS